MSEAEGRAEFLSVRSLLRSCRSAVVAAVPFLRIREYWGYGNVPLNVLLVNFFFQRVLRINRETPWSVAFTSRVIAPENIKVGRNVGKSFAVSGCCYIQGVNGIEIGDETIFSFGVGIVSANHDPANYSDAVPDAPVRIGRACWLGKNAIILPGVQLGDRCIVAAGAVVTKSFEADSTVAGVPAKLVASRGGVKVAK